MGGKDKKDLGEGNKSVKINCKYKTMKGLNVGVIPEETKCGYIGRRMNCTNSVLKSKIGFLTRKGSERVESFTVVIGV